LQAAQSGKNIGVAPSVAPALTEAVNQAANDLERQLREGAAWIGLDLEFRSVCGDPFTELNRIATETKADAVGRRRRPAARLTRPARLVRVSGPVCKVPEHDRRANR
jgi:hypothetical protein